MGEWEFPIGGCMLARRWRRHRAPGLSGSPQAKQIGQSEEIWRAQDFCMGVSTFVAALAFMASNRPRGKNPDFRMGAAVVLKDLVNTFVSRIKAADQPQALHIQAQNNLGNYITLPVPFNDGKLLLSETHLPQLLPATFAAWRNHFLYTGCWYGPGLAGK